MEADTLDYLRDQLEECYGDCLIGVKQIENPWSNIPADASVIEVRVDFHGRKSYNRFPLTDPAPRDYIDLLVQKIKASDPISYEKYERGDET